MGVQVMRWRLGVWMVWMMGIGVLGRQVTRSFRSRHTFELLESFCYRAPQGESPNRIFLLHLPPRLEQCHLQQQ